MFISGMKTFLVYHYSTSEFIVYFSEFTKVNMYKYRARSQDRDIIWCVDQPSYIPN